MAGHSQFKNIMHRKGRADAVRSKLFSKLAREITVAAKMGMPDPDMNPRLRAAILAARAENMPKDNIERAIKKSQGGDAENYEEIRYEGYGPGGAAIIVEAMTDNRNRTASDVRSFFTKAGGNLAETGAVSFMFDRVGTIEFDAKAASDDAMLEAAIEAGASDVESDPEAGHTIWCEQGDLAEVTKALEAQFGEPRRSALVWKPQNAVPVDDEAGEKLLRLMEALDGHDDVQNVYGNFEVSDALMAKMGVSGAIRILGLDPGLRRTGWGLVISEGNRLSYVASGTILSSDKEGLAIRLRQLHDGLWEQVRALAPDEVAVEETFVNENAQSTLKLGHARAMSLLVPALAGLPVAEYAANLVKKTVVGTGHADKRQIQAMVRVLLPKANPATDDAADALAVAITHAHHRRARALVG